MVSKAARVRLRRFHRWAGVIVGIQLLFWVGSGIYFAWMPIEVVKDEDRRLDAAPPVVALDRVVAPGMLALPPDFTMKSLRLEGTPAGPLYRLESTQGSLAVFDGLTGQPARYLSPGDIRGHALRQMQGAFQALEVDFLDKAPAEYKGPLPVYRITLDDARHTRLYADPWSGRVIMRRNVFWRVYDFLWMLHILDFKEREDFNNPWLKFLSLGAFTMIASGYLLFLWGRVTRQAH